MGGSTYFGGIHLEFEKLSLEKGKKLHKYTVFNKAQRYSIGEIHWRGGWRQYVFEAVPHIDMSRSCQKEIINFIDKLMKEWQEGKNLKGVKIRNEF